MKRNWREHYNVFVANLVLVIGFLLNVVVARYTLVINAPEARFLFLTPFLGIIAAAIFYFFDIKWFLNDFPFKKFHFQKKWTYVYFVGLLIFMLNILINIILLILLTNNIQTLINNGWNEIHTNQSTIEKEFKDLLQKAYPYLWSCIGVSTILSLFSVGFHKWARFKIDIELLKAKRGEHQAAEKTDTRAVIVDLAESSRENKTKKDKDKTPTSASSGMTSL